MKKMLMMLLCQPPYKVQVKLRWGCEDRGYRTGCFYSITEANEFIYRWEQEVEAMKACGSIEATWWKYDKLFTQRH